MKSSFSNDKALAKLAWLNTHTILILIYLSAWGFGSNFDSLFNLFD